MSKVLKLRYKVIGQMQESKINTVTKNTNSSTSIHSNLMKIELELVSASRTTLLNLPKAIYI